MSNIFKLSLSVIAKAMYIRKLGIYSYIEKLGDDLERVCDGTGKEHNLKTQMAKKT